MLTEQDIRRAVQVIPVKQHAEDETPRPDVESYARMRFLVMDWPTTADVMVKAPRSSKRRP